MNAQLWPLRIMVRGDLWVFSENEAWDHFVRFLRLLPEKMQNDIKKNLMTPQGLEETPIFEDLAIKAGTAELASVGVAIWRATIIEMAPALDASEGRAFD